MNVRKYPKNRDSYVSDKIPPSNIEIECHVLGTLINRYDYIGKYPYLKKQVFYKESHQLIFAALYDMYNNGVEYDPIILADYMRKNKTLDTVGGVVYIHKISSMELISIDTHVKILMDKFFCRELIRISSIAKDKAFESANDPIDIIDDLQQNIIKLTDFDGESQNNFKYALKSTINSIIKSSKEGSDRTLKSGFDKIDKQFTFRTGYVCIIAGPEGSAKTKFTLRLARGFLDNEPNIAIQWFSFEDNREEIIRGFISMDIKITSKELQSINYKMSDDEIEKVNKITGKYENYTIDFYDDVTSIENIVNRSKRFSDKYKDKKKLVIIDNLGLVGCKLTGIERDDYLAGKIKYIANSTGSSVILIHHFTKEISRKQNIEDGYRPRKEYLKGSTRILDFVQQALFVNLLRKYPDILSEEKRISLDFIKNKDIEFSDENFNKYLWSINGQRCPDSEQITDLRGETLLVIRNLLENKVKDSNANVLTFSDIIKRYTEYSNFVDNRNRGREPKYLSAKDRKRSIYIFIKKKMYNENFAISDNSPRSKYLYGGHKGLKYLIDDLFIVESVKNRDDNNIESNAIFRFIIDLGYNIFREVKDDGTVSET